MRACCSYVSQALKQARLDAGLMQEDIFSKWGLDGWNVISRKRCLEDMLILNSAKRLVNKNASL